MEQVDIEEVSPTVQANRLLSGREVQGILGIGKSALYAILRSKKDPIPSFKIGKSRRFKLDKLMWWIEKHEQ